MKKSSKNKITIVLVFAAFLVPAMIATLLHSEWLTWRPGETRNHGELIEPVIELPDFSLTMAGGDLLERADLIDQWQLVHHVRGACGEDCLEQLYWLRQVRLAQDRHQPDIGLMVLIESGIDSETVEAIRELSANFRILHGEPAHSLGNSFPMTEYRGHSYIVDPDGNIIMGYASDADPNGIRRDLRRLLTWTQRD